MARKCIISGTKRQSGHRVSHAKNKTKHQFQPNLQRKRVFVPELGKNVSIRVTARLLKTIDKLGLNATLKKHNLSLADIC